LRGIKKRCKRSEKITEYMLKIESVKVSNRDNLLLMGLDNYLRSE